MENSSRTAPRGSAIEPICDSSRATTFPFPPVDRHHFVWLRTDACTAATKTDGYECVARWVSKGLPVIVARRSATLGVDELNLGIALRTSYGHVRIAFTAPVKSAQKSSPPPRLTEVIASAPCESRGLLSDLCAKAEAKEIELRVFGSFAWQHFTHMRYVTRSSDIDLLWRPHNPEQLATGVELLSLHERKSGFRLDGEIVFPDGGAVAWREIASRQDRVLVKRLESVSLQDRDALLKTLGAR